MDCNNKGCIVLDKTKRARICELVFEASTGFEPVMRVLQTLALPLGHDAIYNNEDC